MALLCFSFMIALILPNGAVVSILDINLHQYTYNTAMHLRMHMESAHPQANDHLPHIQTHHIQIRHVQRDGQSRSTKAATVGGRVSPNAEYPLGHRHIYQGIDPGEFGIFTADHGREMAGIFAQRASQSADRGHSPRPNRCIGYPCSL